LHGDLLGRGRTPRNKKYLSEGAVKPASVTGSKYVKWGDENEKLQRDLMVKGDFLK
jgi:hypothetical protein